VVSASSDLAWERALELAWESFCGGTTPVGAVVTDAAGAIVAEGRGRRFENAAPPGQLAWTGVAHAELNALAQLGPDRHYTDHALLTTLEPGATASGSCPAQRPAHCL
jgi:tRNA(Arg) A34 adenosine deaminase TadA